MPENVRITKEEDIKIHEKCIEINKILISSNRMPMRESELIHKILEIGLNKLKIDKNGEMYFE